MALRTLSCLSLPPSNPLSQEYRGRSAVNRKVVRVSDMRLASDCNGEIWGIVGGLPGWSTEVLDALDSGLASWKKGRKKAHLKDGRASKYARIYRA